VPASLVAGAEVAAGAGMALLICYALGRLALDRRRLARGSRRRRLDQSRKDNPSLTRTPAIPDVPRTTINP
jgi:hypothetical protein